MTLNFILADFSTYTFAVLKFLLHSEFYVYFISMCKLVTTIKYLAVAYIYYFSHAIVTILNW